MLKTVYLVELLDQNAKNYSNVKLKLNKSGIIHFFESNVLL